MLGEVAVPPRKRNLAAVVAPPAPAHPAPPDLREAVAAAIEAMPWVAGSDTAVTALALRLAAEIETVGDRARELDELRIEFGSDRDMYRRLQRLEAMCDQTKVVGWLGPLLQGVLRDLAGTPQARKALGADAPIGGRLAELRAEAAKAAAGLGAGVDDPEDLD